MRILGIDPGLGTIGYGIIDKDDKGKLKAVDYGTIKTAANVPVPKRLNQIYDNLTALIEIYHPDCMAVEELFFNSNVTTGIVVAQARGVILLCGVKLCAELYEYSPREIKLSLTGTGSADKHQMQFMSQQILKLSKPASPDDAADALAIAITHAHSNQKLLPSRMTTLFDQTLKGKKE